ncbi:MAG TPA: hypothetical protein VNO43_14610 [Candidatus Eisenbacteria bacterium]|nr:hypothetical protein [Candidatus Eisenbacteria bacterium]
MSLNLRRHLQRTVFAAFLTSISACNLASDDVGTKSASLPAPKLSSTKVASLADVEVRVTGLLFYASGISDIPPIEPKYNTRFRQATTSKIYPEIRLAYPPPGKKIHFTVTVHVREKGRTFRIVDYPTRIEPEWTSSQHAVDIGAFGPGTWPPAVYEADIHINGEKVATGTFEVY